MTGRELRCRKIARGAVEALAYCHERGVAHGSLGSGSILLSTFDDRKSADLVVKLDNFGFARMQQVPGLAGGLPSLPRPPHQASSFWRDDFKLRIPSPFVFQKEGSDCRMLEQGVCWWTRSRVS